jgi:putative ABC transport system substrate-binding protein
MYRVGILAAPQPPLKDDPLWAAFEEGFRDLGYIQGQNLVLEGRFAGGDLGRLPALAAELSAIKVDVMVVFGPAPKRARKACAYVSVAVGIVVELALIAAIVVDRVLGTSIV